MKNMYLVKYSVKGIKSLDKLVSLAFYKKTITKDMDTQGFNIKGIYGMKWFGKIRNHVINSDFKKYLNRF